MFRDSGSNNMIVSRRPERSKIVISAFPFQEEEKITKDLKQGLA